MKFFSIPALGLALLIAITASLTASQPNVLLVMTDDQGFGDAAFQGNPIL